MRILDQGFGCLLILGAVLIGMASLSSLFAWWSGKEQDGALILFLILITLALWLFVRGRRLMRSGVSTSTPSPKGAKGAKGEAVNWARGVLSHPARFVILDTETTGLDEAAEVVQIAIIGIDGAVLLNEDVRPLHRKRMPREAQDIHGISMDSLKDAKSWPELSDQVRQAVGDRVIISYNAEYDERLLEQTAEQNGGSVPDRPWACAMLKYAAFFGEWNEHRKGWKWQKLAGGDHSALGDCRATLALIKRMAS
jgi:DNA polymerase III subunit epsilon